MIHFIIGPWQIHPSKDNINQRLFLRRQRGENAVCESSFLGRRFQHQLYARPEKAWRGPEPPLHWPTFAPPLTAVQLSAATGPNALFDMTVLGKDHVRLESGPQSGLLRTRSMPCRTMWRSEKYQV